MHELSHIILGHDLADAEVTDDGHLVPSNYDQDQEDQADWLGGTLLLPRPALIQIRKNELTDDQAREKYLVSHEMLRWRFRMTGVDFQFANLNAKRSRRG
jgi:Zn-dependent peptidase ImmA (M78 family)